MNDCLYHFGNPFIPFGGVGPSGMGGYHGKFSMEAFSHKRAIMRRDDHMLFDVPIRYPPYKSSGLKVMRFALLHGGALPSITYKTFTFTVVALVFAVVAGVLGYQYRSKF